MESHTLEMAGSSATPASSRWNPTKEQINMLENLYKQGIRTPSAEQIRQITARLRAYSDIEGKNVFYWFQNHKSRQRLKQKQESIAYFSRFLHSCHPIFSSSICPNVPQRELGFYPQYSMVILTGGLRESPITEKVVPKNRDGLQVNEHTQQRIPENFSKSNQGTLTLFPLHPTGILEGKTMKQASNSLSSLSADTLATSESSDIDEEDDRPETQSFDFFSLELGFRESD